MTKTLPKSQEERVLTINQAAALPGAPSAVTIRRHIRKGALRAKRVGPYRRIRISERVFREYLGHDHL